MNEDDLVKVREDFERAVPLYVVPQVVDTYAGLDGRTLVRADFTEVGTNRWTALYLDVDQATLLARSIYDALEGAQR